VRLLALKGRTAAEVRRLLDRRGFEPGEIEGVLARLIRSGYLNDAEFAASYVRTRGARRALGPVRLAAELRAKGIADADIAAALAARAATEDPAVAAARAAARKWQSLRHLTPEVARRRLAAHLERQGFSTDLVLTICRTTIAGDDASPPAERPPRR
jgi:regulatory protein